MAPWRRRHPTPAACLSSCRLGEPPQESPLAPAVDPGLPSLLKVRHQLLLPASTRLRFPRGPIAKSLARDRGRCLGVPPQMLQRQAVRLAPLHRLRRAGPRQAGPHQLGLRHLLHVLYTEVPRRLRGADHRRRGMCNRLRHSPAAHLVPFCSLRICALRFSTDQLCLSRLFRKSRPPKHLLGQAPPQRHRRPSRSP